MRYCYDFIKKFRKEGNFCGLDKSEVSRLEAYVEIIEALMKQHIEEKTIVDNFPLGAARHLIPIKDERRADGLSYVTQQLKAGKHISGKDIQQKLEISNKKPQSKQELEKGNKSVKIEKGDSEPQKLPPEKCFSPQPHTIPVTDTPMQSPLGEVLRQKEQPVILPHPAPCTIGQPCPDGLKHFIEEKNGRGKVCMLWNLPCNQLPDPGECYITRKERLKGTKADAFQNGNQVKTDGLGNTFKTTPPYVISRSKATDAERDAAVNLIIDHTDYTKKDIEQIDELVDAGYEGNTCRASLISKAVLKYIASAEGD